MTISLEPTAGTNILTIPEPTCDTARGFLTRLSHDLVMSKLSTIEDGQLILDDQCSRTIIGTAGADDLNATLTVNHPAFYGRLVRGGSLGLAETYIDGLWDSDNLPELFRIFSRNLHRLSPGWTQTASRLAARVSHWLLRNTKENSRSNISAHYDLGNDFFSLFLDESMMYSAGMFDTPDTSLEDAQQIRMQRVCESLDLQPEDHVIEIGTGWGGMARYMAEHFGCRVTTTTISQQQFDYATNLIQDAGLEDQVTVLLSDYRDLDSRFDKLVSLEMIEAVGPQFYDTYFSKCNELLKPGGRMLLQAIVIPEQRYESYLKSVDFIQKYIFPGGSLPSVNAMQHSVAATTNLRMLSLTDFADGYARTLREWRRRFFQRLPEVREQGYSEKFIRMWDYYLTYCEGAFDERAVGVVHAVWGK